MPTQPQRRSAKEETPSTQTLQYWMGRVDANITELMNAFSQFVEKSDESWEEFNAWRRRVDERLQAGSARFDDHHNRLVRLETVKKEAPEQSLHPKEPTNFGTWAWFRDGYLEKALLIIITLSLYKLIELIIQNWNSLP